MGAVSIDLAHGPPDLAVAFGFKLSADAVALRYCHHLNCRRVVVYHFDSNGGGLEGWFGVGRGRVDMKAGDSLEVDKWPRALLVTNCVAK